MRVFLAGATGAIGRRLAPMLIAAGHEVTGLTRTPGKVQELRERGVRPVLADALNREELMRAVAESEPEAVIHMLTAVPRDFNPRRVERDLAINDRLHEDGTRDLVAAAQRAGASRFIAQSIAFAYMPLGGIAGRPALRPEDDPLDFEAPKPFLRTINALHLLEHTVRSAEALHAVVLRLGYLYGPGTAFAADGATVARVRQGSLPIIGEGEGVWSFVHVDDAARAAVAALAAPRGVYNVVDDDPAPVREWLPELARTLRAPRPRRMPKLLARPIVGAWGVAAMTRPNGASNDLAKRELGWAPSFPSWREGFRAELG